MSSKDTDDKMGFYLMLAIPVIQVAIWVVSAYLGGHIR